MRKDWKKFEKKSFIKKNLLRYLYQNWTLVFPIPNPGFSRKLKRSVIKVEVIKKIFYKTCGHKFKWKKLEGLRCFWLRNLILKIQKSSHPKVMISYNTEAPGHFFPHHLIWLPSLIPLLFLQSFLWQMRTGETPPNCTTHTLSANWHKNGL